MDFSGYEAFFDPFDTFCNGTDLPIMGFLLLLDGLNNSGEFLIFVFQGPELAVDILYLWTSARILASPRK